MANGALTYNPGGVAVEDPETISQQAQDVAKATGVAYEDVATETESQDLPQYRDYDSALVGSTLEDQIEFKPTETYIDKARSTVAGQLESLLAADSPYIRQAERAAEEKAQSRNMLNTTLAIQAGREAAISQALPIAQQDAQTYAKGDLSRMAAEQNIETIQSEAIVSGEMVKQKAAIDQANKNINNAFQARIQGASEQSKVWLNDLQNTYNANMQGLQAASQQMLLETELDSNRAQKVRDSAASIMQNYQISVENMLTDPDFLNLGAESVQNALNQLQTVATNSIGFIGASAGIDMDPFIEAYMAPIDIEF